MVHEAWGGDKVFPKAPEMAQRPAGRADEPVTQAGSIRLAPVARRRQAEATGARSVRGEDAAVREIPMLRRCSACQCTVTAPPVTWYAVRVQFRPQPNRTALSFTFAKIVAPLPEMSVALNRVLSG